MTGPARSLSQAQFRAEMPRISLSGGVALSRPTKSVGARSLTAWIVRSIILATTAFALLDLYLLTSAAHNIVR